MLGIATFNIRTMMTPCLRRITQPSGGVARGLTSSPGPVVKIAAVAQPVRNHAVVESSTPHVGSFAEPQPSRFVPRTNTRVASSDHWFRAAQCNLHDLLDCSRDVSLADYPFASTLAAGGVVVYDCSTMPWHDQALTRALEAELAAALSSGPGVVVLRGAFSSDTLDAASEVFREVIEAERRGGGGADHFAAAGSNSRVWNSLEKLAVQAPEVFVDYYSNHAVAAGARAWLGPGYQVTSQVNVVHPGGLPQAVHRDYHLGFMSDWEAERYPAHVHRLSPQLTLQGAVAHVDMPVESGPTLFLPHSHKYDQGYLAWRRPEFQEHFEANAMQLALEKGDLVFFNPALFHAAGHNQSEHVHRMANLLQVNSAFGRAMEAVDRLRMLRHVYPALLEARATPGWDEADTRNVIAACAEGYPFPTNLDRDPPSDGLAPPSQADLVNCCVAEGLPEEQFLARLDEQDEKRRSC